MCRYSIGLKVGVNGTEKPSDLVVDFPTLSNVYLSTTSCLTLDQSFGSKIEEEERNKKKWLENSV